jgi:hypothetical protein
MESWLATLSRETKFNGISLPSKLLILTLSNTFCKLCGGSTLRFLEPFFIGFNVVEHTLVCLAFSKRGGKVGGSLGSGIFATFLKLTGIRIAQ